LDLPDAFCGKSHLRKAPPPSVSQVFVGDCSDCCAGIDHWNS